MQKLSCRFPLFSCTFPTFSYTFPRAKSGIPNGLWPAKQKKCNAKLTKRVAKYVQPH